MKYVASMANASVLPFYSLSWFLYFFKLASAAFFVVFKQTLSLCLFHPDSTEAEHLFIMFFIFFPIAYILIICTTEKETVASNL